MKKSGNVTIRLGPREVKQILESEPAGYYRRHISIERKVYDAVASKFSDVEKSLAEEKRARNICVTTHGSEEWKEIEKNFLVRRRELDDQYRSLTAEENQAMQDLTQAKLDEAGIVGFEARGYSFRRKEVMSDIERSAS